MPARTSRRHVPTIALIHARCWSRSTTTGARHAVAGDPDHPITAGFLCGKVSNYLDRVYAEDRLLEPLIRDGEKGAGGFAGVWDEALDRSAERLESASASRFCPTATWAPRASSRATR